MHYYLFVHKARRYGREDSSLRCTFPDGIRAPARCAIDWTVGHVQLMTEEEAGQRRPGSQHFQQEESAGARGRRQQSGR